MEIMNTPNQPKKVSVINTQIFELDKNLSMISQNLDVLYEKISQIMIPPFPTKCLTNESKKDGELCECSITLQKYNDKIIHLNNRIQDLNKRIQL
jgi:hypothetical protein